MSAGETRILELQPCDGLAGASRRLAEALDDRDVRRGSVGEVAYLRIEQPLDPVDPLPWLRAQAPLARFYWAARDHTLVLAGAGIAEEVEGEDFDTVHPLLERAAGGNGTGGGMRLLLSARFDPTRAPDNEWAPYKRVYAQLPLLELRLTEDACRLAVNLKAGTAFQSGGYDAQRRTAQKALGRIRHLSAPSADPVCLAVNDNGAEDVWTARVNGILARIGTGGLRKAVLAHRTTLEAAAPVDPFDLLAVLRTQDPVAFHYLLQPTPQTAFVGASPERLYRRRGTALRTEALAGTCIRGPTAAEDERLGQALLKSTKDELEHTLVRDDIRARLAPLCEQVDVGEPPELQRLRHVQHLRTPLGATLKDGVDDADLLAALHPTPAVCGLPRTEARDYIRASEHFDRGLYCGPLGVVGAETAECAVAIRSALVQGRQVQLFAGAGIVEGSDPAAEWRETLGKMRLFEAILGASHGA